MRQLPAQRQLRIAFRIGVGNVRTTPCVSHTRNRITVRRRTLLHHHAGRLGFDLVGRTPVLPYRVRQLERRCAACELHRIGCEVVHRGRDHLIAGILDGDCDVLAFPRGVTAGVCRERDGRNHRGSIFLDTLQARVGRCRAILGLLGRIVLLGLVGLLIRVLRRRRTVLRRIVTAITIG